MRTNYKLTLRGRIVVAFGMLGFLISIVFAAGVYLAYETMEHDLTEEFLEYELADAMEQGLLRRPVDELGLRVDYFVTDASRPVGLSPHLNDLRPGFHEVTVDLIEQHVLVKDVGALRYVLTFQDDRIERRETMINAVLVAGVLIATYLSVWLGFITSRRVISPALSLANDVRALQKGNKADSVLTGYADDEIGELANAFQNYRQQIEELLAREREFTGAVSHELRTPLTVISNNTDVLLADAPSSGMIHARLQRIRRAAREAGELVGAFLAMARSGALPPGECVPADAVRNVVADAEQQFGADIAVEIAADTPAKLPVPVSLLAVTLRNLLHNALEHGHSPVTVRLSSDGISVSDAGEGWRTTSQDGRGLGLAIVSRLCARLNWRLVVVAKTPGTRVDVIFDS